MPGPRAPPAAPHLVALPAPGKVDAATALAGPVAGRRLLARRRPQAACVLKKQAVGPKVGIIAPVGFQ